MPREKHFDPDTKTQEAMQLFWRHGYEATSLQDLLRTLRLQRGSFYNAFGGKRELFLAALRMYDRDYRAALIERLRTESPTASDAILGVFQSAVDDVLERGSHDGCLLVNTALEVSPHDPEVAAVVDQGLCEVETFFAEQIRQGQAEGEISAHLHPERSGRQLLALLLGLRVLARTGHDPHVFNDVLDQARAILRPTS